LLALVAALVSSLVGFVAAQCPVGDTEGCDCCTVYEQIKGAQLNFQNLAFQTQQLECCFTLTGVHDPVLASDGRIYSREVIEGWWNGQPPGVTRQVSPYTKEPMSQELLTLDDVQSAVVRKPRA
jgi:hypothetical protein